MDPITLGLIMGGVGLGKSYLVDKPKEKKQRELAARTQELSPWTGISAGSIQEADPFGSAMQGFTGGASMGLGLEAGKSESMRDKALAAAALKNNNPWAQMQMPQMVDPRLSTNSLNNGYLTLGY